MSDAAPSLSIAFDTDDFPPGQGLALWTASCGYDVILPDGAGPEAFRARMRAWRLEPLLVTAGFMGAMRSLRTADRARADGHSSVSLMMIDADWNGDFDGVTTEVPRGGICVFDSSRPYTTASPDADFVVLSVPREALAIEGDIARCHGHVLRGPSGALLAEHFVALSRHLPEAGAEDMPRIAAATLALTRSCLVSMPRRDADGRKDTLRQRACGYVDLNLSDAALSPDAVAAALSVNRATLYRAFPSGGLAGYIQARRLDAIRVMLDDPAETRSLSDLAAAFGFVSPTHFATVFRRRFGHAPSRTRRSVWLGGTGDSTHAFHDWLRGLEARSRAEARHDLADGSALTVIPAALTTLPAT